MNKTIHDYLTYLYENFFRSRYSSYATFADDHINCNHFAFEYYETDLMDKEDLYGSITFSSEKATDREAWPNMLILMYEGIC